MYKKLLGLLLIVAVLGLCVAPLAAQSVKPIISGIQSEGASQAERGPLSPWVNEIIELVAKGIGLVILWLGGLILSKLKGKLSDDQAEAAQKAIDYLAQKAVALAEEKIEDLAKKVEIENKGEEKLKLAATWLADHTGLSNAEAKEEVHAALPFVGMGATVKLSKEIGE